MSNDAEPDARLQKRIAFLAFVFAAITLVNGALNYSFAHSRQARNDRVANENVEIDSRISESKKIVEGTRDLLRQANELNERAAKIEATLGDSNKAKK